MKKEKITISITISIMTILLVSTMFTQFKMVNETNITEIETMREDELEKAAVEWKEKYEATTQKLSEINNTINEYNEKKQDNEETKKLIETELIKARKQAGLTEITGEGIIITLTDNDDSIYDYKDILELINELKAAGADAISINDKRIINITDIVSIGERYITVNKEKISSPYIVKVIGDKLHLKSALTIKNGYYDYKIKENYSIEIEEKGNIKIDAYSKEINLRYINL